MFQTNSLLEYWNSVVERCGVILEDGSIIELPNSAENQAEDFSFPRSYFEKYPTTVATWHTHPTGNPNLSVNDYKSFLTLPDLFHYVVGDGIVWAFYVRENKVFLYEDGGV